MILNNINNRLSKIQNKKDNKLVTSNNQFLELIYYKDKPFPCNIFEIIFYDRHNGGIKNWFFVSKNQGKLIDYNFKILKKNKNTINNDNIIKQFFKSNNDITLFNINSDNYELFLPEYNIKFKNGESILLNSIEVDFIYNNRGTEIHYFQKINNKNNSKYNDEYYMVEANINDNEIEYSYNFYKIQINYNKLSKIIKEIKNNKTKNIKNIDNLRFPNLNFIINSIKSHINLEYLNEYFNIKQRWYYSDILDKKYIINFDIKLNEFTKTTTINIIKYLQYILKSKITYIQIEYTKLNNSIYFKGINSLYIKSNNLKLGNDSEEIEVNDIIRPFTKKNKIMPSINTFYSKKLLSTLIIDKCSGDFCDFKSFEDAINTPLNLINQNHLYASNRLPFKNNSNKLFHTIIYNLILSVKYTAVNYYNILLKNNFFPSKIESLLKDDFYKNSDEDNLLFFLNKLQEKSLNTNYNNDLKYRTVKVCEICYNIYNLLKIHQQKGFIIKKNKYSNSLLKNTSNVISKQSKNLTDLNIKNNILKKRKLANNITYTRLTLGMPNNKYNVSNYNLLYTEKDENNLNYSKGFNIEIFKIDQKLCIETVNQSRRDNFKLFLNKIKQMNALFEDRNSKYPTLNNIVIGNYNKKDINTLLYFDKLIHEVNKLNTLDNIIEENNDAEEIDNEIEKQLLKNKSNNLLAVNQPKDTNKNLFLNPSMIKLINFENKNEVVKLKLIQKQNFKIFKNYISKKYQVFHDRFKNKNNHDINKLEDNDYCIECESLYGESCYNINFDKLSVKYLLTDKKYYLIDNDSINNINELLFKLGISYFKDIINDLKLEINLFKYDRYVVIPYYFIYNSNSNSTNLSSFETGSKTRVLIIFNDIFNNFLNYKYIEDELFNIENFDKILLFQYPGLLTRTSIYYIFR